MTQMLLSDMPRMIGISSIYTRNDDTDNSLYRVFSSTIPNIGVCGSFKSPKMKYIFEKIDEIKHKLGYFRIIRTKEDSIGKISDKWARENGITTITVRASWLRHGSAASAIRNEHILNYYSPTLIVCFTDTEECPDLYRRAERRGIATLKINIV